ncbi:MAG: ABC transporter ATP-binding protein, partial [Treponema sp.]|nr:ABC transporter ATP-binding protein [Treponema sp.]
MISVNKLDFSYRRDSMILRNVAFDALEGQCVSILGNNGAGKSTLVKCLNRILKPQSGVVSVCGEQVNAL